MKSIIQSIRPQYVRDILNGIKVTEVRKSYIEPPFTSHTYCTKAKHKNDYLVFNEQLGKYELTKKSDKALNGKVVAEYVCNKIYTRPANVLYLPNAQIDYLELLEMACLTEMQVIDYCGGQLNKDLYFYQITDLKIYDKPKELSEFYRPDTSCGFYNPDLERCDSGYNCKRCVYNDLSVKRPPQDFMYVEELK